MTGSRDAVRGWLLGGCGNAASHQTLAFRSQSVFPTFHAVLNAVHIHYEKGAKHTQPLAYKEVLPVKLPPTVDGASRSHLRETYNMTPLDGVRDAVVSAMSTASADKDVSHVSLFC